MPKRPSEDTCGSCADPPLPVTPLVTPLGIILQTMRQRFKDGDTEGAISLARIAAPYLHPRVSATVPAVDLAAMSDAELDAVRSSD